MNFKNIFNRKEFKGLYEKVKSARSSDYMKLPGSVNYITRVSGNRKYYKWLCTYIHVLSKTDGYTSDRVYDNICSFRQRDFNRLIGVGNNKLIFDIGNEKVAGFIYSSFEFDKNQEFYDYCMGSTRISSFPKIYKYTCKYIIQEKLEIGTPKCKEYYKISTQVITYNFHRISILDLVDVRMSGFGSSECPKSVLNLSQKYKSVWYWLVDIYKVLSKLKPLSYPGDFCLENLGERPGTSDIVYIDP